MATKVSITSPVGRIVMGNLYTPGTTDAEGKPLVVKTGPNAGQPRVNFFFALAIPKGQESHWAHTSWGNKIWNVGNQAFPNSAQSPAFAWKIEDGDSQIPNKKGRKPCENEGWPGHWIVKFSGGFAPKIYRQEGTGYVQMMEKDFCKPGYFVEVAFNVDGNGSQSQPGVYLNHDMVCFRAYGPEIQFGPDPTQAGFGAAPLPAGASMTPPAGSIPMPAAGAAPAGYPAPMPQAGYPTPGGYPAPMPQAGYPAPGVAPAPLAPAGSAPMPSGPAPVAPAPIPVMPNAGFVQMPPPGGYAAPGAAPMPPGVAPAAPVAPAPPARQMTAAAQYTYEQYRASQWTDAMLVQNGLMLP